MHDRQIIPAAKQRRFLWDVTIKPEALKHVRHTLHKNSGPGTAKFSGVQENLSSEKIAVETGFKIRIFLKSHNILSGKMLCLTTSPAI